MIRRGDSSVPEHAPRILLVDDHELVRKGLASLLSARWQICGEAGNGAEAIEKARELKPDLVLLDLSMPVMGGSATARHIRQIVPGIKLVLLSIHDSATVAQLAKAIGADAFLSKGCTVEALHDAVAALVGPGTGDRPPLPFRAASAD
jgi:two-component system, NarL family, nitrate/nitrite response regulator NarL